MCTIVYESRLLPSLLALRQVQQLAAQSQLRPAALSLSRLVCKPAFVREREGERKRERECIVANKREGRRRTNQDPLSLNYENAALRNYTLH